jgi:type III secretion protein U
MSEKTEQPTHQKIRKAREEGQVAHSKDFTQTALILALFGWMIGSAPDLIHAFGEMMLMPASMLTMEFDAAANTLATELLWKCVELLLPYLLIVIGLGLFVEMAQTGLLISFKAMMPSGKKLNVAQNIKNIFSLKSLVEFLKSNVKITLLSVIVWMLISDSLPVLMTLPRAGLTGVGVAVGMLLKHLIIGIALGYTIIALADFAWQRRQYIKGQMMTKDEVKQEYKQAEGDPHIKHQRKHLHQEMLEEGAVNNTRNASVVVTNPTHLAIAILYDKEKTPLPVVLAKGEGHLAYRMVEAAKQEGIPILQDIPLAHALMNSAEVEQYIPSELIEPVAQVLRLVQEMTPPEEDS